MTGKLKIGDTEDDQLTHSFKDINPFDILSLSNASKKCSNESLWEATSFLNCSRKSIQNALQRAEIASISENISGTLKNDISRIVSGDIKNVVEIFATMGNVMRIRNIVVNSSMVTTLATTVDTLLSSTDSVWQEVSKGDSSVDAGAQLLQSMEEITQTYLKSDNYTELAVINNNIVLYLKKKTTKEIIFPEESSQGERNKIRLVQSREGYPFHARMPLGKKVNAKYSVIVYKGVTEKFSVTSFGYINGQKVRRSNIILNSDVISFSVDPKPNEEFLLELTFPIKNISGQYHECVYLTKDNSWSSDGCLTSRSFDQVFCSCTHLSTFAVLMETNTTNTTQIITDTSTKKQDQICQEMEQLAATCPEGYNGTATKRCTHLGTWETNNNNCTRISLQKAVERSLHLTESATQASIAGIAKDVAAVIDENTTIVSGDIRTVVNIIEHIGDVTKSNNISVTNETLQNITTTVDKLLSTADHDWQSVSMGNNSFDVGSKLMLSMEDITQSLLTSPDNFTDIRLNKSNIGIAVNELIGVVELKENRTNEIIFPDPKKLPSLKETDNEVRLLQNEIATVKYSIIVYKNVSEKFQVRSVRDSTIKDEEQETINLNSDVISFSVQPEPDPESLKLRPVKLTFKSRSNISGHQICAYLLEKATWATDGCSTELDQDMVVCTCTHLTNFAVLMSPYEIHETHKSILGLISSVGIVISLVGLAVTIAIYGIMWRYVKSDRAVLHVNLSASLFLGYTIFLVGISRTDNSITCAIVAGFLHFLFLVVFFVMLAQGILLLKSVTSVSSTSILKWLILLIYGGPVVVVVISVAVTQGVGYGSQQVCWLDNSNGLLWAFVAPAFTVLLVNFVILMVVLRTMQTSHAMRDKSLSKRTKSVLRSVCILMPILGITWTFGVLSISSDKVIFHYLFAISNSLQGLLIFIFQCVLQYQVRDGFRALLRRYRATSSFESRTMNSSQDKTYSEGVFKKTTESSETEPLKTSDCIPMAEM